MAFPYKVVTSKKARNHSSRRGAKIDALVLHHTAGREKGDLAALMGARPVSAHFYITKKATIYKMVPDYRAAWHAGRSSLYGRRGVNRFSIGIELENLGNGRDPWPDNQIKALAWLVARKVKKYRIPRKRIVDHKFIAPRRKVDLASNFPWHKFRVELSKALKKKKKTVQVRRLLKSRMRGKDVKLLQKILGVRRTGYFGWRTKKAVRRFQKKHRLQVDGIVGPKTGKKLGLR